MATAGSEPEPEPTGASTSPSSASTVRSRLNYGAEAAKARSSFIKSIGLHHLSENVSDYQLEALEGKHFRYEVATGVWSLHSPAPSMKPRGYAAATGGDPRTHERPDTKKERNPFDLENSHMTPPVIYSIQDPEDESKPMVRVFENKFPVLQAPEDRTNINIKVSFVDDVSPQVSAIGLHEVVVQHWRYNMCQCLMTVAEIKLLWKALFDRFTELSKVSRYVQLMENHGQRSGGSLPHPHAQVLGLPVVPGEQTRRYSIALEYWRRHTGKNVFAEIVSKTMAHLGEEGKDRVLLQNDTVVAFVPHAQERKDEIWIVPKRQCHSFALATPEEVDQLALAARSCLGMLYAARDDPDYNILMRNAPCNPNDAPGDSEREPISDWYRWHLVIIPHQTEWGGIKGYGGFSEVTGTPEQHAAALRAARGINLVTGQTEVDAFVDASIGEGQVTTSAEGHLRIQLAEGVADAGRLVSNPPSTPQSFQANFLTEAGLSNLVVVSEDDESAYESSPIQTAHFRCELSSRLWSLHTPLDPTKIKPRGYSSMTGGEPKTRERPDQVQDGNPFDIRNRHLTPPVQHQVADPLNPRVQMIRVFDNKFPALEKPDHNFVHGKSEVQVAFVDGFFPQVSAIGLHEVVVQHWRYNTCQALMSEEEIKALWETLLSRFQLVADQSCFVQLMENHGRLSGGCQPHPHCQLLGIPLIPGEQMELLDAALAYWRQHRRTSVFEVIADQTLRHAGGDPQKDRHLFINEHMLAFVPHAQERKDEIWIMPKRQCHSFALATPEEVDDLALAARSCLGMLYAARDDPDYNILMRNAPTLEQNAPGDPETEPISDWYRWHLVIIPHSGAWAGIKGYGGFTPTAGTPEQHAMEIRQYRGEALTEAQKLEVRTAAATADQAETKITTASGHVVTATISVVSGADGEPEVTTMTKITKAS